MSLAPILAGVEPLLQLRRQHMVEWQDHLSTEVEVRSALEVQHQSEMTQLLGEECHPSQRSMLVRRQVEELVQLKEQNRAKRLIIRAGQQQEQRDLEGFIKAQHEAT